MLNFDNIKVPTFDDIYGYQSPIELILGDLQTKIENDATKVVQSYGFNVDKEELEKALKYDRNQYEKGYAAAREHSEEIIRELWNCRNELCFRCGKYEKAYCGACDDCRYSSENMKRWRKNSNETN